MLSIPVQRISLLLPILLCCICACSDSTNDNNRQDAAHSPKGKAVLHAIQSEKLRDIMQRMNALMQKRENTVGQIDESREEFMETLIDTAGEVIYASEELALQGPVDDLSAEEEATFRALANQLYTEAVNVHMEAIESNFMEMDAAYKRLDETCAACHRLFRTR